MARYTLLKIRPSTKTRRSGGERISYGSGRSNHRRTFAHIPAETIVLRIDREETPEESSAYLARFQDLLSEDVIVSSEVPKRTREGDAPAWGARAEFIDGAIYRVDCWYRSELEALHALLTALRDRDWGDVEYYLPSGWAADRRRRGLRAIEPVDPALRWDKRRSAWGPVAGTTAPPCPCYECTGSGP